MENYQAEKSEMVTPQKGPITIQLSQPVQFGSERITEITIQPVKGKHLKKLPSNPNFNDFLSLASKLSGVASPVFDEMSASDCIKVVEAVGELL